MFRTVSREATEAALGSGAGWAEKAPAHRIPRDAKGVGFAVDAEGTTSASDEATKFRAVYLDNTQIRDIARGRIPTGVHPQHPTDPREPLTDEDGRPALRMVKGDAA